jgi:hypothetical protein
MGPLAMGSFWKLSISVSFTCALKYYNDCRQAIIFVFLNWNLALFYCPAETISAQLHHRALRLRTSFLQLAFELKKEAKLKPCSMYTGNTVQEI